MIVYVKRNIFDSDDEAFVNPVNTVGVMGKGLALQFKQKFPNMYMKYRQACLDGDIDIGKLFVVKERYENRDVYIINFPTKKEWWKPSRYEYIRLGLDDLVHVINKYNMKSVSIPALGVGMVV